MKKRIPFIRVTKAKKAGLIILSAMLIGTAATGIVFASTRTPVNRQSLSAALKEKQNEYQKLQSAVDAGHQPGLMQPEEVAMGFASGTLKITNLNKRYDKIDKNVEGDRATVTFWKDGKPVLKMELIQPVKKGTGGIWAVTSWTDGKTNETHAVS